jgi:hypothetical protein
MFKPTAVAIPLLTLFLAACGGSDNSNSVTGNNGETGGDDNNTGGTPTPTVSVALGNGVESTFVKGVVGLSSASGLVGSPVKINVNGVDANDAFKALSTAFQYQFSSACSSLDTPTASFSAETVTSSNGEASSDYTSSGCLGNDTVTVKMFASGVDVSSATPLATATADLNLTKPVLGHTADGIFRKGIAGLSVDNALVGSPVVVTVKGADENNGGANVESAYKYTFSSVCSTLTTPTANFSATEIVDADGDVQSTYMSTGCNGSDTITVRMFASGAEVSSAEVLSTATAIVNLTNPSLGTGEGSAFQENVVIGTTIPLGENSTILKANAVNPRTLNSKVTSADYIARWSSDCASGFKFNIAEQNLASSENIETSYEINDTTACASSNVTLSLYRKEDRGFLSPLDTLTVAVNVQSSAGGSGGSGGGSGPTTPKLPALGSGSGTQYTDGIIDLSLEQVLVGGETVVTVTGVDKNAANAPLTDNYRFTFSSVCQALGNAEFSIVETVSSGSVSSTYRNTNCASGDTITVRLYPTNSSSIIIATATGVITTARPLLGNGSGVDYADNKIAGRLALQGETETELTASAVNPLKANEKISDSKYRVKWGTSCTDASFSVLEQDLSSDISTKYRTNGTTNCLGDNNLTLELFEKNNPSVILDTVAFVVNVQRGIEPKIGIGKEGTFDEGKLDISDTTINAAGRALIAVNIVDGNSIPTSNSIVSNRSYGLTIESNCSIQQPAQAEFNRTETIVAQGENVGFNYTAKGCINKDIITVRLYAVTDDSIDKTEVLGTATGELTVASPELGAISYEGADRTLIAIEGLGSSTLPTQTSITFKVVDKSQLPMENRVVQFALSNTTGGVELASDSNVTDADGLVKAIVNSGTANTQVAVKATVVERSGETAIPPTNSLPISITTGIADQDSFEIVADVLNPNAATTSGTNVNITAFAADQFNNPVPDGTTVNFTAESGIIGSRCTMVAGSCSVTWTSSGERPGEIDSSLSRVNEERSGEGPQDTSKDREFEGSHFGMTTIMAFMEGEAGFTDSNNNGLFDANEPMRSLPEPIRNDNWCTGACTSTTAGHEIPDKVGSTNVEFFADYDNDRAHDIAPSVYQGALCTTAAKGLGHCGSLAFISNSLRIVQSEGNEELIIRIFNADGSPQSGKLAAADADTDGPVTLRVLVQDVNGNIPPSGTTLSISGDGYEVVRSTKTVRNGINDMSDDDRKSINETYNYGMYHDFDYIEEGVSKSISILVTSGEISTEVQLQAP